MKGHKEQVSSYADDGHRVKTYSSMNKAADDVGGVATNIMLCTQQALKKCKNLYWRLGAEEQIKPPVAIYKQNFKGDVFDVFYSVKEAAKAANLSYQSIYDAIRFGKKVRGFFYKQEFSFKQKKHPIYINPHTKEERQEYRRRVMYIAEKLHINDYVIDDEVREFHKWEKRYSRQ